MSTLDMGIYRLSLRQWTGLTALTPLPPPPSSLPPSHPPILATDRHFFSHRCQASSDREIHPSSSSPWILSHLSPSYQTLTRHEPLLVIAFLRLPETSEEEKSSFYNIQRSCLYNESLKTMCVSDSSKTDLALLFMSSFVGETAQLVERILHWQAILVSLRWQNSHK